MVGVDGAFEGFSRLKKEDSRARQEVLEKEFPGGWIAHVGDSCGV